MPNSNSSMPAAGVYGSPVFGDLTATSLSMTIVYSEAWVKTSSAVPSAAILPALMNSSAPVRSL